VVKALPGVELERAPLDSRYYHRLRLLYGAETPEGAFIPVVDIGLFDWVARLTTNRRFRLAASGAGIQLFPLLFRKRS
jgi:hypothetical protein